MGTENRIPEVWIINLQAQQLEVYREPDKSGYSETLILQDADTVKPLAFPDVAIAVQDILG